MADTKKSKKKPSNNNSNNIDHLKTDIASFASSLGLATSLPSDSSGFNDVDFRPTKPQHRPKPQNSNAQNSKPQNPNTQNPKPQNRNTQNPKPNERPNFSKPTPNPFPEINTNNDKAKSFENLPKLPLISATEIGVWYEEAEELEAKVVGKVKKVEVRNDKEWSGEVAKRRKLGERLMAQYTADYEAAKGRSGDIKLLLTTQRSGTASDKISAFSVLVGDDPIANLRSLNALIGMVSSKVGKRYAFAGFDALRELFLTSLLPDRKLKSLLQRPLNDLPETKEGYSLLLLWYWEECLKQRYERLSLLLRKHQEICYLNLKTKH